MKVFNEFENPNPAISNEEIKKLIIQDLVAKIGWIRGNYPSKKDSITNLDILFRHLAYEYNESKSDSDYIWDNTNEIFTEIVKLFPISKYFFGKEFPKVRWFIFSNTVVYTLI